MKYDFEVDCPFKDLLLEAKIRKILYLTRILLQICLYDFSWQMLVLTC